MDALRLITERTALFKCIPIFIFCISLSGSLRSQQFALDPRECGYACSAQDVILSSPYLASDLSGTKIQTCDGDSGNTLQAYIAFTLKNTTGSDRYTPMISANLNIDGVQSTVSGCFTDLMPNQESVMVLPLQLSFYCESEIFLEKVWIGWNVTPKSCEQLQSETSCNKIIPSGKCGDYNSFPYLLQMPVETPMVIGQENTISRCSDGVDNDGNGLTDCDDFDCTNFESCDYTTTSSGMDGGLESNNRLLGSIAKRQYQRSIASWSEEKINRAENQITQLFATTNKARKNRGLPSLEEVIPLDVLPETVPYLSTPEDLPELTNALRSLSVDFYRNNQPVAAILGTRTLNRVYEHTKVICDRVGQTRLEKIWAIALDGKNPMLINKLKHKDGTVEYSCSFSARLQEDKNLIIESHWNVYEYPQAESYINFQVWAANTQTLRLLVLGIVNKLGKTTASNPVYRTGEIPPVYIRQTMYRNHVLELEVANPGREKNLRVSGILQRTEGGSEENFEREIALSGNPSEKLEIDTEAVYSLGLTLWGKAEGPADAIFFADGIWAKDIDPVEESAQFLVFRDYQSRNEKDWFVERGIQISGEINKKYAWYRALNNTFKEVALDNFKVLGFETQSEKAVEMEVVLAQPGQVWENQLRTRIRVNPGQQKHILEFDSFQGNKAFLKGINMVVFVLENNEGKAQEVRLVIQKMRFSMQQPLQDTQEVYHAVPGSSLRIFPNPLMPQSEIGFYSSNTGKAFWKLSNSGGQVIRTGEISVTKGDNQQGFYQEKLSSGVYFLELHLPDSHKLQTKVLMR